MTVVLVTLKYSPDPEGFCKRNLIFPLFEIRNAYSQPLPVLPFSIILKFEIGGRLDALIWAQIENS